jgi:hypothetical protein
MRPVFVVFVYETTVERMRGFLSDKNGWNAETGVPIGPMDSQAPPCSPIIAIT